MKEKNHCTFREISSSTGVSLNSLRTISKFIDKNITIMTVMKLAEYFSVSLDDLVYKDLSILHGHHVHVAGKEVNNE